MFKLIIQDDEGKTTVVPLIRDEITIGRKEGNTIRLTERNVSRKHARIVKANGAVVVEDLDSYNGVKVNGTRIQGRVPVNESDRIQIGDYLLELKLDRANQTTESNPIVTQGSGPGPSSQDGMSSQSPSPSTFAPTPVLGPNGHAATLRATKQTTPIPPGYGEPPRADSMPPSAPPSPSPVPAAPSSTPGRLVVVSSNFGGREFVLSKTTMVIGRTEDNDIVVNHRSISRHHAKIVLEQGRYCIVDMQSSNGVRVNGEEYGKVELRRGDVVDLGHVRVRYVEPGEDFVFDRDAQIVDIAQRPAKSRGVLLALLSVAVLGGGAAVFLMTTTRNGDSARAVATASSPPVAAAAPPVANPANPPANPANPANPLANATTPPPTEPAVVPGPVAGAPSDAGHVAAADPVAPVAPADPPKAVETAQLSDTDKLIADSREATSARDWRAASAAAAKALAADPKNDEAKKLQEHARAEQASEQIFKRFSDSRSGGRTTEALKFFAELPKDSVYRADAEKDVPAIRDQFIKDRVVDARALADKGQCERLHALARRSGDWVPEAKAAVERVGAKCSDRSTPTVAASPSEGGGSPLPAATPSATPPPTGNDSDRLIAEAKEAAKSAKWAEARTKADEVLRGDPDNQDALSVAGIAACNLADKDRALKYIAKLRGTRQNMMKQICAARGVTTD